MFANSTLYKSSFYPFLLHEYVCMHVEYKLLEDNMIMIPSDVIMPTSDKYFLFSDVQMGLLTGFSGSHFLNLTLSI